ncbi:MAG TPA: hypothetical protein VD995_07890 [Azospirillum sp.]|nr:hypothetical protein [Azospirillum sp.]
MERRHLVFALLAVCLVNGIFSPLVFLFWRTAPLWMPGFVLGVPGAVFYVSSLTLATLTLLVSGVPAALYERLSGAADTNVTSLWIWLAGAVVLSLPAGITLAALA